MDNGRLRPVRFCVDSVGRLAGGGGVDGGQHNGRLPGLSFTAFSGRTAVFSKAVVGDDGRFRLTVRTRQRLAHFALHGRQNRSAQSRPRIHAPRSRLDHPANSLVDGRWPARRSRPGAVNGKKQQLNGECGMENGEGSPHSPFYIFHSPFFNVSSSACSFCSNCACRKLVVTSPRVRSKTARTVSVRRRSPPVMESLKSKVTRML